MWNRSEFTYLQRPHIKQIQRFNIIITYVLKIG